MNDIYIIGYMFSIGLSTSQCLRRAYVCLWRFITIIFEVFPKFIQKSKNSCMQLLSSFSALSMIWENPYNNLNSIYLA